MSHLITEASHSIIWELIVQERIRQNNKFGRDWGNWGSPHGSKLAVLTEEVGEIATAILKRDEENLKEELIQVAAVCIAWLEDFYAGVLDEHQWGVGDRDN